MGMGCAVEVDQKCFLNPRLKKKKGQEFGTGGVTEHRKSSKMKHIRKAGCAANAALLLEFMQRFRQMVAVLCPDSVRGVSIIRCYHLRIVGYSSGMPFDATMGLRQRVAHVSSKCGGSKLILLTALCDPFTRPSAT